MMFLSNPTWWQAGIEGAVLIAGVVNFFSAAFFWRSRATFPSKDDLEELELKLEAHKTKTAQDFKEMDARTRANESSNRGLEAEIKGVRDGVARVERLTTLLIEFRMREAEANG